MKRFTFLVLIFLGFNFSLFGQTQKQEEEIVEVEQHSEDFYIDLSFEDLDVEVLDSKGNELSIFNLSKSEKQKFPDYCFLVMDKTAIFEGENKSFYEIVKEQIHFSKTMKKGIVFIGFEIDTTGKMTNLKIIEGLSEENDKEALRVMNLVNEKYSWTPASEHKKKIKVKTMIYVHFERKNKLKQKRIYKR